MPSALERRLARIEAAFEPPPVLVKRWHSLTAPAGADPAALIAERIGAGEAGEKDGFIVFQIVPQPSQEGRR